jgi:hypothetical protein
MPLKKKHLIKAMSHQITKKWIVPSTYTLGTKNDKNTLIKNLGKNEKK